MSMELPFHHCNHVFPIGERTGYERFFILGWSGIFEHNWNRLLFIQRFGRSSWLAVLMLQLPLIANTNRHRCILSVAELNQSINWYFVFRASFLLLARPTRIDDWACSNQYDPVLHTAHLPPLFRIECTCHYGYDPWAVDFPWARTIRQRLISLLPTGCIQPFLSRRNSKIINKNSLVFFSFFPG